MKSLLCGLLVLGSFSVLASQNLTLQELADSEYSEIVESSELISQLEEISNSSECPDCPILFTSAEAGLAYANAINEGTVDTGSRSSMVGASLDGDAGVKFSRFSLAANVGLNVSPVVMPYYAYYGGMLETTIDKKSGLYLQAKINQTHHLFKMYDEQGDFSYNLPSGTLVGGQIGLGKNQRFGLSFMKDLKGNWTQIGIKMEFQGKKKSLKKRH